MSLKQITLFLSAGMMLVPLAAANGAAASGGASLRISQHMSLGAGAPVESAAIDSEAREVWLARGDSIDVVNADSGKTMGTLKVGGHISAIQTAPDLHAVLATDRVGGRLLVIDSAGRKLVRTLKVGKTPSTLAYYTPLKRAFVGDRQAGTLTAIDLDRGQAVGTLKLADGVGQLAANTYGQVFVASPESGKVHYIDAAKVADMGAAQAGTGDRCGGIAIDYWARRLFLSCANGRVAVIDTDVGMTIKDLPGAKVPTATSSTPFAFGPIDGWRGGAFFLGEDGTLSSVKMISPVKYATGPSLALPVGARSVVIDAKEKRLLSAAPGADGWELLVIAN